jgi:hypothetical protein
MVRCPRPGGTPADPTPIGTFRVLSKDAHFRSTEFHNAPMPTMCTNGHRAASI